MVIEMAIYTNYGYPNLLNLILINTTKFNTPSPFQTILQFPVSQLQSYIPILASDFHNIRFVYNGMAIPAGLISISNGVANIWIKLPVSIPANSSITIYMEVYNSMNFDGVYWSQTPMPQSLSNLPSLGYLLNLPFVGDILNVPSGQLEKTSSSSGSNVQNTNTGSSTNRGTGSSGF